MRSNRLQPNPVQSPQAIDCDLSMRTYVQRTVSRCFTALRQIRRCVVGHTSDACGCTGALPVGLWEQRAGRPSGLPDASTRLIYRVRTTRDHITDALAHRSYLRSTSFNLKRIFLANLLRCAVSWSLFINNGRRREVFILQNCTRQRWKNNINLSGLLMCYYEKPNLLYYLGMNYVEAWCVCVSVSHGLKLGSV